MRWRNPLVLPSSAVVSNQVNLTGARAPIVEASTTDTVNWVYVGTTRMLLPSTSVALMVSGVILMKHTIAAALFDIRAVIYEPPATFIMSEVLKGIVLATANQYHAIPLTFTFDIAFAVNFGTNIKTGVKYYLDIECGPQTAGTLSWAPTNSDDSFGHFAVGFTGVHRQA